jgi:hypothetical protein
LASGRLKRVHFVNSDVGAGKGVESQEVRVGVKGKVDERDIDDLISFIEGKDSRNVQSGGSAKKNSRGNPRRRGGVIAGKK